MATWQDRLKASLGDRGFENGLRRSLQTVLLYEAKRCVEGKLPSLRPFQRKLYFMDTAVALLETLDYIFPHLKPTIFWRTATSREILDPEIGWKRVKGVEKELDSLRQKIKPFMARGRSHDDAVNMMVQSMFEEFSPGNQGKICPPNWEHAHNHVILAFRIYFRGSTFDPTFPDPVMPRDVAVVQERPDKQKHGASEARHVVAAQPPATQVSAFDAYPKRDGEEAFEAPIDVAAILGEKTNPVEERRKTLQEVREHLELLKEFEGVIPEEEIAKRKRELFLSLPAAPSTTPSGTPCKKTRTL